jgi:hypothetical protein
MRCSIFPPHPYVLPSIERENGGVVPCRMLELVMFDFALTIATRDTDGRAKEGARLTLGNRVS